MYYRGMDAELTFGEWLEDKLRELRITQTAFANLVDVSQSTVSAWVNDVSPPRRRVLPRIAEVLGVDDDDVRRRAGYDEPPDDEMVERRRERMISALFGSSTDFAELIQDAVATEVVSLQQQGKLLSRFHPLPITPAHGPSLADKLRDPHVRAFMTSQGNVSDEEYERILEMLSGIPARGEDGVDS
jgi:transcriptional regulator with XRE-family HTH domain